MIEETNTQPRGVLHIPDIESKDWHARFAPSPGLRGLVEHYWTVRWSFTEPVVRETIPHPSVHLVFEDYGTELHGVHRKRFSRTLRGDGRVLGVKFRPGGFYPFFNQPAATLTGQVVNAHVAFGAEIQHVQHSVQQCPNVTDAFEIIDAFLCKSLIEETELAKEIAALVQTIQSDRNITRVDQLVTLQNDGQPPYTLRQLQRLFKTYVGISPKETIQRLRLIETAEMLRTNASIDFASLALHLGYADQAHLIRDFKRMTGHTPNRYVQSLRKNHGD